MPKILTNLKKIIAHPFTKRAIFFTFPLFVVLVTQYAASGSFASVQDLVVGNTPSFLFSYFLVALVFSLLWLWIGASAFFVSSVSFVFLATVSFYKNRILNDYLFPTDLLAFGGESGKLTDFVHIQSDWKVVLLFLVGIVVSFLYFRSFRHFRLHIWKRLPIFLGLLVLSIYIFTSNNFRIYALKDAIGYNIEDVNWRQKWNYEHNGFITAFFINLGNIYIDKPANYSKETIDVILKNTKETTASGQTVKPNVIFVLSEAFWDITKIPGITFEKDPLANFHALAKESTSGNLLSPTYGGRTEWVEFEALTGNMVKFLPFGSMPYEQYVKKPIPSIPSEFKKNGYDTLALHTYEKTFFDRYKAYPLLGFDTFLGVEDLKDPKYRWPFVSDDELADQIIGKLQNRGMNPLFLFAISMENHFTYEGEKYPSYDVSFTSDKKLSDKSMQILRNYAQWLSDADKSLGKMVEYIKSQKAPTVLVFFGDHLGSMGDNYYTYQETGYIKSQNETDWNREDYRKMYSTPLLIWDNFGLKQEKNLQIGASYLGNYLLDLLNFKGKNPYFDFISDEFRNCIVADSSKLRIDRSGSLDRPECKSSEYNHSLLQYDIMFGNGFSQEK